MKVAQAFRLPGERASASSSSALTAAGRRDVCATLNKFPAR
ncbi:MAG TPA: hypothetical protein VFC85_09330 [Verrucomicrobiae bacterium]|nr:hypothetical protein [Verrucomicrobiae bacterium]